MKTRKNKWECGDLLVLGHRGFSAIYPENTLLSFREAIRAGADGVELDVRLTKDNYVIVIHDSTVDRTSNMKGVVKNMSIDEIKKAGLERGEKIPLLEEVFESLPYSLLNIEIKEIEATEKTLRIAEKHGMERVMLSSFDINTLYLARSLNDDVSLGYLVEKEEELKNIEKIRKELSLYSVNLPVDGALILGIEKYREILKKLRNNDLKIVLWPSRDDLYYQNNLLLKILEFVDIVITDDPKKMRKYLKEVL